MCREDDDVLIGGKPAVGEDQAGLRLGLLAEFTDHGRHGLCDEVRQRQAR